MFFWCQRIGNSVKILWGVYWFDGSIYIISIRVFGMSKGDGIQLFSLVDLVEGKVYKDFYMLSFDLSFGYFVFGIMGLNLQNLIIEF